MRMETSAQLNENKFKEDRGKLRVRQGEGPESKIGGSVRNSSKHEFDRLNNLMNKDVTEGMVAIIGALLLEDLLDLLIVICITIFTEVDVFMLDLDVSVMRVLNPLL
jgi:hypothetical protein